MKIRKIIYTIKVICFILRNIDLYFLRWKKFFPTAIKSIRKWMRKADKTTLNSFASTHNNDKGQPLQTKSGRVICSNCIWYNYHYGDNIECLYCPYAGEN